MTSYKQGTEMTKKQLYQHKVHLNKNSRKPQLWSSLHSLTVWEISARSISMAESGDHTLKNKNKNYFHWSIILFLKGLASHLACLIYSDTVWGIFDIHVVQAVNYSVGTGHKTLTTLSQLAIRKVLPSWSLTELEKIDLHWAALKKSVRNNIVDCSL